MFNSQRAVYITNDTVKGYTGRGKPKGDKGIILSADSNPEAFKAAVEAWKNGCLQAIRADGEPQIAQKQDPVGPV